MLLYSCHSFAALLETLNGGRKVLEVQNKPKRFVASARTANTANTRRGVVYKGTCAFNPLSHLSDGPLARRSTRFYSFTASDSF